MLALRHVGIAALVFALCPLIVLGATVSVDLPATVVNVGQAFTLHILASEFITPLDGGGLDITWDAGVLGTPTGSQLVGPGWIVPSTAGTPGAGSLTNIFFFALPAKAGAFPILDIDFTAVAAGNTQITLTESLLNPFAGGGGALPVSLVNGAVTVNQVEPPIPEPQTFMLIGGGFGLLVWWRRKLGAV